MIGYFETLSNWGRWGDDDRLGTLKLIIDEVRRAAAATVRDGAAVSLAFDMDPQNPDPLGYSTVIQRYIELNEVEAIWGRPGRFDAVREYVGLIAHDSPTHLDGLAYFSWDGKNYNGFDVSDVRTVGGATKLSIHHASQGIITRGVLLGIPALLGVPWLEPGYAISPHELVAGEKRQGLLRAHGQLRADRGSRAALGRPRGRAQLRHAAVPARARRRAARHGRPAGGLADRVGQLRPAHAHSHRGGSWAWGSGWSTTRSWTSSR